MYESKIRATSPALLLVDVECKQWIQSAANINVALWIQPATTPVPQLSELSIPALPYNILIVEDNPANLKVLTEHLQRLHYTKLTIATTGVAAVEKAIREPFDIILMDLLLPGGIDGIQASRQILQYYQERVPRKLKTVTEHYEHLLPSIVALTAWVTDEVKQKCKTAQIRRFVDKPLTRDKLASVLQDIVTQRQKSQQAFLAI